MIQVTNVRRASSSSVTFRRDSGAGSAEGAETWGSWYNDKHYSLEVIQHPIRARMCGFGDKDRRPLAPAAVAKMIIRREDDSTVDVDDIDVAFFVVTVDLWSADGKQEMNLVLHPSSADRYIPTHVSKPRRRGNGPGSGSSAVDSQSSQPSLQALPPPAVAYAQYQYQHGYPGYPAQPLPPPPGMPDSNTAAGPNHVPPYHNPAHPPAPYSHYPEHGSWGYPPYPYQHPGYPGYPGPLPPIQSFHSRMGGTPGQAPAPAPWSSDPARNGDPHAPASTTEPEGSNSSYGAPPPAPGQVYGTPNPYGPPPPVDGGPLYAMQPYGPPPPAHYPYAPPPPPAPIPTSTPAPAHHQQSQSQSQPPPPSSSERSVSASRPNQNTSSSHKSSSGGKSSSNASPSSPSAPSVPLPRHTYTRTLVGPLSANAARLNDEHRKPGIFFLFQDLSIRTEGTFRLRLRLMNVGAHPAPEPGANRVMTGVAPILAQTFTEPFTVYSAKRFPGVPDTTGLSIAFGNQGQKLPLRNRHGSRHQVGRRRARDESDSEDDSDGQ